MEKTESPSKKKNTAKASKSVGASLSAAERKVCLWPTGNGSTCGKTFTKFDSLKRHLSEAHKGKGRTPVTHVRKMPHVISVSGLRPFACTLCDKSYGRRDYLQRHLKSHNASYAVNLAGSGSTAAAASSAAVVKKVHLAGGQTQNIVLQVQQPQSKPSLVRFQFSCLLHFHFFLQMFRAELCKSSLPRRPIMQSVWPRQPLLPAVPSVTRLHRRRSGTFAPCRARPRVNRGSLSRSTRQTRSRSSASAANYLQPNQWDPRSAAGFRTTGPCAGRLFPSSIH